MKFVRLCITFSIFAGVLKVTYMRIKEVIKEKGLTVGIVATRMGVVSQALSRVINGNPTVDMLERVAKAIGVPITDLFDRPADTEATGTCPHCGKPVRIKLEE